MSQSIYFTNPSVINQIQTNVSTLQSSVPASGGLNITGNASITGALNITGVATVGSIIPQTNNVHSLGSATNVFKDIWVGTGSVHIGSAVISADDLGNITSNNNINVPNINYLEKFTQIKPLDIPWPQYFDNYLYCLASDYRFTTGSYLYHQAESTLTEDQKVKIWMGCLKDLLSREMLKDRTFQTDPNVPYCDKILNLSELKSYAPYIKFIQTKFAQIDETKISDGLLLADYVMTKGYIQTLVNLCNPYSDLGSTNWFNAANPNSRTHSLYDGTPGSLMSGIYLSNYIISDYTSAVNYIAHLNSLADAFTDWYNEYVTAFNNGWRNHIYLYGTTGTPQGLANYQRLGSVSTFNNFSRSDWTAQLNISYDNEGKTLNLKSDVSGVTGSFTIPAWNINRNSTIAALVATGALTAAQGAFLTGAYKNVFDNVVLPAFKKVYYFGYGATGTGRVNASTDDYPGLWARCTGRPDIGDVCYLTRVGLATTYNSSDPVLSLIKNSTGVNPSPRNVTEAINNFTFFTDSTGTTNSADKLYQLGENYKVFFEDCQKLNAEGFGTGTLTGKTYDEIKQYMPSNFTGPTGSAYDAWTSLSTSDKVYYQNQYNPIASDRLILKRDFGFNAQLTGATSTFNGYPGLNAACTTGLGAIGVYVGGQYGFSGPNGFKVYTGTAGAFVPYTDNSLRNENECSGFTGTFKKPIYVYNKWDYTATGTDSNAAYGATGVNYGNMGAYGFHYIWVEHFNIRGGNTYLNLLTATSVIETTPLFFSYFVEWFCKAFINVNLLSNNGARLKRVISDRLYNFVTTTWNYPSLDRLKFYGATYSGNANATYFPITNEVRCYFEVKDPVASWTNYGTFTQTMFHEFILGHTVERAGSDKRTLDILPSLGFNVAAVTSSAQSEGWAMYSEVFLLPDLGLDNKFSRVSMVIPSESDPDYARLFSGFVNQSRIAYRLTCDVGINYSKYGWSLAYTIEKFLESNIDPGKAATFICRFFGRPGQSLGYAPGSVALYSARKNAQAAALASQSDPNPANRWTFDLRQFHDIILWQYPGFTLACLVPLTNLFIQNKGIVP